MILFCLTNLYRKYLMSFYWRCRQNSGFWADTIDETYCSLSMLLSDEFLMFIRISHWVLSTVSMELSVCSQNSVFGTFLQVMPMRLFLEEFVEFPLIVSTKLRLCSWHCCEQLRIWFLHIDKLGGALSMEFKVERQMTFSTSWHLLS